jgi:hypothetical protein
MAKMSPAAENNFNFSNKGFQSDCPNVCDSFVIQKLAEAPPTTLPVDKYAHLLCQDGALPTNEDISALRKSLIQTYLNAGMIRWRMRANKAQIACASKALNSLTSAIENLDNVRPLAQRGLRSAFGSPVDDIKGESELNSFSSECQEIRLAIVPHMLRLWRSLDTVDSKSKPPKAGERKKRLRILVECLANWWISEVGRSIGPYVVAKRLDHRPVFTMGRRGDFLSLALALFCEVDQFKESEVIAAVTNVHEDYLTKKNSTRISTQ